MWCHIVLVVGYIIVPRTSVIVCRTTWLRIPQNIHPHSTNRKNIRADDILSLSLSFLLPPLWSIGHPWNVLFHFSVLILRQSVGLLGRGISPSQGRYRYKHRINTDKLPCLDWDSNSRSSVRAGEDNSCPRPRGYCDRRSDFGLQYFVWDWVLIVHSSSMLSLIYAIIHMNRSM
jgi:hypothetical protein